ncbi:MAG: histidine phosphatase family protein [Arcicella sp.]|nr:histidine phosphatase family protein [Arcicella sp.]
MTKTLYLVRHAKASDSVSPDLIRPLVASGMIDAARMGRHLASKMQGIDLILTSNSERTQMTAQVFCEQLGIDNQRIKVEENLYESSPMHYLTALSEVSDSLNSVMIVGHNPSISHLAEYLTGEEIGSMPTCAVVGMTFHNLTWTEITKKSGKMSFYDSPDGILGMKV